MKDPPNLKGTTSKPQLYYEETTTLLQRKQNFTTRNTRSVPDRSMSDGCKRTAVILTKIVSSFAI